MIQVVLALVPVSMLLLLVLVLKTAMLLTLNPSPTGLWLGFVHILCVLTGTVVSSILTECAMIIVLLLWRYTLLSLTVVVAFGVMLVNNHIWMEE